MLGVVSGDRYDELCPSAYQRAAIHPNARSAIVVASGGRALWAAIGRAPEAARDHRINEFTQRIISDAVAAHLVPAAGAAVALWPTEPRDGRFLPAMSLAIEAGVGVPSKLALLIHPTYGLWIGIRAVVLATAEFAPTPPLRTQGFDPCGPCHAPCAKVCHGAVITDTGYDSAKCMRTRIMKRACRRTCDARLACPVGAGHQYSAEQLAHHARHLLSPDTIGRYALFLAKRRFDVLTGRAG